MFGSEGWVEADGFAHADGWDAGVEPAALARDERVHSAKGYGQDRGVGFVSEQAYAGTEGQEGRVEGLAAFGKDEDVVAVVEGFSHVREAAAEARLTRYGEDVEERGEGKVLQRGEDVLPPVNLVARVTPVDRKSVV